MGGIRLIATACIFTLGLSAAAYAGGSMKDPVGDTRSWYIEGRIGAPIPQGIDVDTTSNIAAGNGTLELDYDNGLGGGGAVGLYLAPRLRGEVEIGFFRAEDPTLNFKTGFAGNAFQGQTLASRGDVNIVSFMANVLYEFSHIANSITPFAGIGVGLAHVDVENVAPAGAFFIMNDSDTVFNIAGILGLDVKLSEDKILTGRYTLLHTSSGEFQTTNGANTFTAEMESMTNHVFSVGLRIMLN